MLSFRAGVLALAALVAVAVAQSAASSADTCTHIYCIGDRHYKKNIFLKTAMIEQHLVVDKQGTVLYITAKQLWSWRAGDWGSVPEMVIELPAEVRDMVMDPTGVIWLGTNLGIYTYIPDANAGKLALEPTAAIVRMAVSAKGVVHVVNSALDLFYIQNKALVKVLEVPKVYCLAFSREDNMFYTTSGNAPVFKKTKDVATGVPLEGLPAGAVYLLEVDRMTNYLFITHASGMYYLNPDDTRVKRVDDFGVVVGMGMDNLGNIFLGTAGLTMRMSILRTYDEMQSYAEHTELVTKNERLSIFNSMMLRK